MSASSPVVAISPASSSSTLNGAASWSRATRFSCFSGSPIQALSPSGAATSSAKKVPSDLPVIRRTTSPTRNPYVTLW
ncbi:hypothetical protein ACFQYP_20605 [Nonomuraea antimicrobica]